HSSGLPVSVEYTYILRRARAHPDALCPTLPLPHSSSQRHNMRSGRGQPALDAIQVLIAFRQDERRSALAHRLDDLVADDLVPALVVDQRLVEPLEFDPLVAARVRD